MRQKILRVILHLVLIVIGLIWIYPFVWMIFSSLKTDAEILTGGLQLLPENFLWENYERAWIVANFNQYFKNSVILTVSTVAIVVVVSSLMGYALGRIDFPGKRFIMLLYVATLFIPKGYTIIPIYLLVKWFGLLNTMPGVILAESSGAHVLFVLLIATFFSKIPKELEESAELDGCGFIQTFTKIMFPLAKPIIATVVIMQFIYTWNSFFVPLIFTLGAQPLRTLAVAMFSFAHDLDVDYSGMIAAATMGIVPVVTVFIFFQRYFIEGLAGSVKG